MSGVKNFVSNTGSLLRGEPFSHVKSPNANGVTLSTPSVASGDVSASGIACAVGAAGLSAGADGKTAAATADFTWAASEGVGAAGLGAAASAGDAAGAAAGMFITMSWRVALLLTTRSDGASASGYPSTCTLTDH